MALQRRLQSLFSAVLTRHRAVSLAGVTLLGAALVAGTLYMPWNGHYAWHRADACFEKEDYPCALHWYEIAEKELPEFSKQLHKNVVLVRRFLDSERRGEER